MKTRYLALAALLAPALPAQAQTGLEAFNPLAMMAPMMTPFGMMLLPMMAPTSGVPNLASLLNPAMFMNPAAMMPGMSTLPTLPFQQGYGLPGALPFPDMPQGMPFPMPQQAPAPMAMPQMANPFAAGMPMMPFPMPSQGGYALPPGFPMMPPVAR
jgi:hypothetical protein